MINIVTGKLNSGKTKFLQHLIEKQPCFGFLELKRFSKEGSFEGYDLYSIATGDKYRLITMEDLPGIKFDKYTILEDAVAKGNQIILNGLMREELLVIDEVGPIELKNQMFHETLKKVVTSSKECYITIRESLVDTFIRKYQIEEYKIIRIDKGEIIENKRKD